MVLIRLMMRISNSSNDEFISRDTLKILEIRIMIVISVRGCWIQWSRILEDDNNTNKENESDNNTNKETHPLKNYDATLGIMIIKQKISSLKKNKKI